MAMTVKVGMKVAVALQAAMVAVVAVEAVEAMGPRYTRRASRRFVLW